MPLYKPASNPAQMAQSAMNAATQAAAAQTKQTTTTVKKDSNVWDDIYKGAVSLAAVGRGIDSLVGAADSARQMYDQHKLRKAYEDVSKAFGEGGFEAIQRNPDMLDYWHAQAVGQFVKDRAGTEKGRLEMLKSMDDVADKQYQDWRIQAARTEEAWKAGNMQQFMPFMQQLSNITPGPHRLVPTEDGRFKVLFRSDKHYGEFVETGQVLTAQQTVDMMRSIRNGETYTLKGIDGKLHPTNPIYGAEASRSWWGTVMGNSENRVDPNKQLILYRNNQPYAVAMLQNPHDDPMKNTQYEIFALSDGRALGIADGVPGLLQRGLSPFAPQKQKGGSGKANLGADPFHREAVGAGYIWDDKQKWYFRTRQKDDGTAVLDYSQPMSRAAEQELRRRTRGEGLAAGNQQTTPPPATTATGETTGTNDGFMTNLGKEPYVPTSQKEWDAMGEGVIKNLGNAEFMSLPAPGASFTPGSSPDARFSPSTADSLLDVNNRAGLALQREAGKSRLTNAALLYNENYDPAAYGRGSFARNKSGDDEVTPSYRDIRSVRAKEEFNHLLGY